MRRLHPVETEGLTRLQNVYPLSEFIRSIDPLFRPVDMTTAPDGTMYITDMYRGIIQESQWSGPGTYLRARIKQYGLDKVIGHGRIWRLTYEGMGRDTTAPRMLDETAAQLVTHLTSPNGWWRDTAQQLLVLKQDQSVVPALKQMFLSSDNQLARIHALWTLEGLDAADAALVRQAMKDPDPRMRLQAIRVSETLYKEGDRSFGADYRAMTKDTAVDVAIQAMMTLNTLKVADAKPTIQATKGANQATGVQLVADTILNDETGAGAGLFGANPPVRTPEQQERLEKGKGIFNELCFSCHGDDGHGTPKAGAAEGVTMAPPLAGSPRVTGHRDYVIRALLNGMTGPIDGNTYTDVMVPMGQNPDDWVAAIGSYVRNAFGNEGDLITPADVARVRKETASHKTQWTVAEIETALPHQVVVDPSWTITASHNTATASNVLSINAWTSGVAQQPGMWVQVELPRAVSLTELEFESTTPPAEPTAPGAPTRTGGGRGRGGAAQAPPVIGFPLGYQVQVSTDGTSWSAVASGKGAGAETDVTFAPARARFVRITQTGSAPDAPAWTMRRLKLFALQ